jgi:hypothetical protein
MNQRTPELSPSFSSSSSSSTIKTVEPNVGKFVTWESPAYGVKINYPSNWLKIEQGLKGKTVVVFKSPKESPSDMIFESVGIGLHNAPPNLTLEQVVQVYINRHRQEYYDFNLIESVPTTLGRRQAHRIVSDAKGKRFMGVVMVEKNKVYQIAYTSIPSKYDSYLPIVQKMLDSFEITAVG